jgi:hypothetical protein
VGPPTHAVRNVGRHRGATGAATEGVTHMTRTGRESTLRFEQVHGVYWALLAGALLLALAAPMATLWRTGASPLHARACLWPSAPHADAPTYLFVALSDAADRTAVQGPWAEVKVSWDMTTMRMGTPPVAVHGPLQQGDRAGLFAIPLRLTMVGPWWIHVTLRTPGRPVWQTALQAFVLNPQAVGEPAATDRTAPPGAVLRQPFTSAAT